MTEWISIEVVADHGVVRINLPDGACTDMTGVIRMAKALMPHVWRIETWSGDRQDTVYLRSEDGE